MSQGDLFQGGLDIPMIRAIRKRRVVFAAPEVAEDHVVVKVSFITMTHTPLVHPERTFAALQNVQVAYLEYPERLSDTVKEIGTVLYAGFETEVGIVLIMSDLSKQGYTDLQPQQHWHRHGTLEPLWGGFVELVKNVLLPLAASAEVIHPDIRPGFDVTSNILWTLDSNTGKPKLKLIDYDSFVIHEKWVPDDLDGGYLKKKKHWSATTFVWWQCLTIAFVWKMELNQSSLQKNDQEGRNIMSMLNDVVLLGRHGESWLMCLHGFAMETDETGVLTLLDFLSKLFDGTEEDYFGGVASF